ncbi:MAG TPA: hypothetical protein VKO86_03420 [Gemmatimonadales bacterium]|nr:hypothetical protein [Gemmatimonadales bacterium]
MVAPAAPPLDDSEARPGPRMAGGRTALGSAALVPRAAQSVRALAPGQMSRAVQAGAPAVGAVAAQAAAASG